MNTAFADSLDQAGIPYTFQSYSGSHFNQLSNRFAISLTFLDSIMIPTSVNSSVSNGEPYDIILYQNYPNPFNAVSTIKYSLPEASKVVLEIFNINGQVVKTLVNENQTAGMKSQKWDGTDSSNIKVSSGIYIYRIQIDGHNSKIQSKKMVLIK
jgi:hypothetical protein